MDDIRYICNNIFGILRIPVYFINDNEEVIFEFSYEYSQNPLHQNQPDLFSLYVKDQLKTTPVVVNSTTFFETFIFIGVRDNNKLIGTIVIGPCLSSEIDEKSIDELIRNLNIQAKYRQKLIKYYQHLVILNYENLMQACSLIYFAIYREQLTRKMLMENSFMNVTSTLNKTSDFDSFMQSNRRDNSFHHSSNYENELLGCIREGNTEKLLEFAEKSTDGDFGTHSKNPLRNQKNLFISFSSIVSHAAIEGGLDWELALSLSDYYVQLVEEKSTIKDIMNLYMKMFLDFAERVKKAKAGHSPAVVKCKNYIYEHLFDKISLSDLSEATGMNSSYISHLFKKEVGLTVSDYIQKERIEEAKKIMLSSDKSLAEIYAPLGFIDQSHFTKVFKKFVGVTPKDFRITKKHI
jgi:YSIRK-targeted surface antigen transcriptional regulator